MIVSFYSYKGGVGRSQLCANIAAYLCFYQGKKILLWEWDYEAPGLHFFFGKTNEDITQKGTLEIFEEYVGLMKSGAEVPIAEVPMLSKDNILPLKKGTPKGLVTTHGRIDLLPAGIYTDRFAQRSNDFNWYEFYEDLDGGGYLEYLKEVLNKMDYDYIFIDSRTGVSDYSGICNLQLPDTNVVVMAANNQNIAGCKTIIDKILQSDYTQKGHRKAHIFPILSRINTAHQHLNYWFNLFTENFHSLISPLDINIDPILSKEVFQDIYLDKTLLYDEPQLSAGENVLFTDEKEIIPRSSFQYKYATIANYLLKITEHQNIGLTNQIEIDDWQKWANEARSKKEYDKEIKCYEKIVVINPNDAIAYNNMGVAYSQKSDNDKAIECYEEAIAINPNIAIAYNNMGSTYERKGNYDKAIEWHEKAIAINPNDTNVYNVIGNTYDKKGDCDKAIEFYEKAITINPNNADAYNNMGTTYLKIGNRDVAQIHLQKSIDLGLLDFGYKNIGHYFLSIRQKETALDYYQQSVTHFEHKDLFWERMKTNYHDLHLIQYGITEEEYQAILSQI